MTTLKIGREDWLEFPPELERLAMGGITTPPGFVASGVACGLKESGGLDMGVLRSTRHAASALVDTSNALPSESVIHTRSLDRTRLQAVVVNAGNANAQTGAKGIADAATMGATAAEGMDLDPSVVAVCSTGVIGRLFDMDKVTAGASAAAAAVSAAGGEAFSAAICTTDRSPKTAAFRVRLPSGEYAIGAAAKGAGMIQPNMATMLAYITTDAPFESRTLQPLVKAAVDESFNRISVDGQMSPSDTVLVFANGEGQGLIAEEAETFGRALRAICRWLALMIVRDGEGAEHVVRLIVSDARDGEEAETVARAIANSPLIKAAVFGKDPNWGRVTQAVGAALAGRPGPPPIVSLAFDGVDVNDEAVHEVMAREEYEMHVGLGRGEARAEMFFCDLTHAYVSINSDYTT
jgi:glutamate N-acetyltransferase/amino-acid N-acetyltransferase